MLEDLPVENADLDLVRLASLREVDQFFENQQFGELQVSEVMALLASRGIATDPEKLVDQIFKPKRQLEKMKYRTRFSDGSFPVLYGSVEARTSEMEVKHWFSKQIGVPTHERTAHYMRFKYRFRGEVKDLRQTHWPALTDDNGYEFCNKLGREAVKAGIDGLLTPSARNKGGTNLPAFRRQAVGGFSRGEPVAMTYDPQTGETTVREG